MKTVTPNLLSLFDLFEQLETADCYAITPIGESTIYLCTWDTPLTLGGTPTAFAR